MNLWGLGLFIEKNLGKCDFRDKYFLNELLYIFKSNFVLEDYIKDIKLENLSKQKAIAIYRHKLKIILFDPDQSYDYFSMLKRIYNLNNIPKIIKEYYYYVTLLHEVIHACQFKFLESDINNLTTVLLKDSLEVARGNFKLDNKSKIFAGLFSGYNGEKMYMLHYPCFPIERQAIVISSAITMNIFNNIVNEKYTKIIKNEFLKECLYGYAKNYELTSPTEEFYRLINNEEKFMSLNYCKMNYNDRLELGLPLTEDEICDFIKLNNPDRSKKLNITLGKNSIKF